MPSERMVGGLPGVGFVIAALPLWGASVIAAFVGVVAWRRAAVPGARWFALLMLGIFIWALGYAIALSTTSAAVDDFSARFAYVGVVIVPVACLLFAAQYSAVWPWLSRPSRWWPLFIVPALTLVAVFVRRLNGIMWVNWHGTPEAGRAAAYDGFAWWFMVHALYSYLLIGIGATLLVRMAIRVRHVYRKQAILTLFALAIPLFANLVYLLDTNPQRIDLTPFVLSLATLVLLFGLFRFRLLDVFAGLVPVARDAAVEAMADGVVAIDAMGRIADINPAGRRLLGREAVDLVGHPADGLLVGEVDIGTLAADPERSHTEAVVDGGEQRRYYDLLASSIGDQGESARIVVIRDMTEQRRAKAVLGETEDRFRALFERASDFVFTLRPDGTVEAANKAALDALEYTWEELSQLPISELLAKERLTMWERRIADPVNLIGGVYRTPIVTKSGRLIDVETSLHAVMREGSLVAIQGIARDVTERNRWEATLRHQASHDGLTELPNRVLLAERVEAAIKRGRLATSQHALIVIDLDRFKEVNDTYGHDVGDGVLKRLGARFRGVVRDVDTIARLGGDEFAVFMPDVGSQAATKSARRMLAALEEPVEVDGRQFQLQASIGIGMYPDHGVDVRGLLRAADVAMYRAKKANTSPKIYSAAEDPNSPARLLLLARLREAVKSQSFALEYQPIVAMTDGQPLVVEALARWHDERLGVIEPNQFIPLLEETGLIMPFTLWALREAVSQAALWSQQGSEIAVGINLSARNLHDATIVPTVQALCREYGVSPSRLMIEVTEGSIMTDPDRALQALARLADEGVSVTVDDFGTGYSSLAYLQRLPVTHLKVERSFIHRMVANPGDAAIVRSTISLGHDLGLAVIAEGVELRSEWETLQDWACDAAQGFFVAPPLPAQDALHWLTTR